MVLILGGKGLLKARHFRKSSQCGPLLPFSDSLQIFWICLEAADQNPRLAGPSGFAFGGKGLLNGHTLQKLQSVDFVWFWEVGKGGG